MAPTKVYLVTFVSQLLKINGHFQTLFCFVSVLFSFVGSESMRYSSLVITNIDNNTCTKYQF